MMFFYKLFYISVIIFSSGLFIYLSIFKEITKLISITKIRAIYVLFSLFILFAKLFCFKDFLNTNDLLFKNNIFIKDLCIFLAGYFSISKKHNTKTTLLYSITLSTYFAVDLFMQLEIIHGIVLTFLTFLIIKPVYDENTRLMPFKYLIFFLPVFLINMKLTNYLPYAILMIQATKHNALRQDYFLLLTVILVCDRFECTDLNINLFSQVILLKQLYVFLKGKHAHNYIKFEENLIHNITYIKSFLNHNYLGSLLILLTYLINKYSIKFEYPFKRRVQNLLSFASIVLQIYLLTIALKNKHYYYVIVLLFAIKKLIITKHGKQNNQS
jgi:hypothetical protein